ncbi:hypothetical protein [Micromonospora sp. GCM10011541]|uniref:hypothetical protein n=1 Tax=Micromonospora sp. GCM10011541 TaxID=3317336 RepID=UPI003609D677
MSSKHTVDHIWCPDCQKRGFESQHLASKALGKAQTKRNRLADKAGTRRGMNRENRFYNDCPNGLFHLTGMSRRFVTNERQYQ